jgi:hypothetical protein
VTGSTPADGAPPRPRRPDHPARPRQADARAAHHRRARRRLPPDRRRDGQPRPPRPDHADPGGSGLTASGPVRHGIALDDTNLVARASASPVSRRRRAPRQADPPRRRPRRRLHRRRRRAALVRLRRPPTTWSAPRTSAPTSRSVSSAGAPACGHRRGRRAAPPRRPHRHAGDPAARRQHAGRVPGVGRPRRTDVADGPNDLEPAALAVEPELRRWRDLIGDRVGRPRPSPAAAPPGSSTANAQRPRRSGRRGRSSGAGTNRADGRGDQSGRAIERLNRASVRGPTGRCGREDYLRRW